LAATTSAIDAASYCSGPSSDNSSRMRFRLNCVRPGGLERWPIARAWGVTVREVETDPQEQARLFPPMRPPGGLRSPSGHDHGQVAIHESALPAAAFAQATQGNRPRRRPDRRRIQGPSRRPRPRVR
jgi:hypothetical protein